jgi:DNA-binding NarL/FixJ family response regulator
MGTPGATLPDRATTLDVAIRSKNGGTTERIARALARVGWRHVPELGDGPGAVIAVHQRAGSGACAEVRELAARSPDLVIAMVLDQTGSGDVRRALQAGARAVVAGSSVETALVASIRAAFAGQLAIPAQAGAAGTPRLLTTREKQILGLMVMGMTNAAIASKLFLAESTVKSHLSSAFAKLGVSSRSEAAAVILDPHSGAGLGILTIQSD